MPHDQHDPAHIVDQLAGGDMASTLLADLPDDQLAAVGRIALQRRSDDLGVIGQVAAEFNRNRGKPWREIAILFGQESHMTIYRLAQPFIEGAS
jgi:hypothetical protein